MSERPTVNVPHEAGTYGGRLVEDTTVGRTYTFPDRARALGFLRAMHAADRSAMVDGILVQLRWGPHPKV